MGPSDRTVDDPISLLGQLEESERQVRRLRAISEQTTGTAASPDGLIEATVGMHGEVRDFVLDPRVFRTVDADALADQIRQVINEALEDAQKSAARELAPLLPSGAGVPQTYEPFLAQLVEGRKGGRS